MLNKEQYPAIRVSVYFPSMIEEFYGDNIEILQVIDSTNKKVGFESIIGQRTHSNEKTLVHIPECHLFAVILVFCANSKRSLIYIVDRNANLYFYNENHNFIPNTQYGDDIIAIIKNLLSKSRE